MLDAGLNVVRMNFSHGNPEDHRQTYTMVRELAAQRGTAIGILQDLQGPKIRVGRFAEGSVTLSPGDKFVITMDDVEGDAQRVSSTYKGLAADVHPGMALLLDDGNMALRVEGVRGNDVTTSVVIGGVLKNN
jgi:pyruvate kinase